MKKSEVLKQICDIIHLHRRVTKRVTSIELSEMVLDKVEEAGMLPKPITCPLSGGGKAFLYVWEAEDD